MNNLFHRDIYIDINSENAILAKNKISKYDSITKFQMKSCINKYGKDICEYYAWDTVHKWIYNNQRFTYEFINGLKQLLNTYMIYDQLTSSELNYINYYENIVFAQHRNWKNLLVSFDLISNDEEIIYKYDVLYAYQIINDKPNKIFDNCEIYISTKRIIVSESNMFFSIPYDDITLLKLKNYWLEIKYKKIMFYIYSNDLHYIFNSIEQIFKFMGIYL